MLRDLNISTNGRRDSTDPRVGVPASEIPSGFAREAFLRNDIDAAFPNRLYSLEILSLPTAGVLYLNKAGVGSFQGAPAGTYTGTERVAKYDPGVGLAGTATGSYAIQVTSPAAIVNQVTVSPSTAAGAQQFTAQVIGDNSPSQDVTWSKVGGGTLSSTGYFVPPAATPVEQVITIKATSTANPTKFGTASVTIAAVAAAPVVTKVTVTPATADIAGGAPRQFFAEVIGENNPAQAVTWATTLGDIDAEGNLTAPPATEVEQAGTVTATSVLDPTKSGTATFAVIAVVVVPDPVVHSVKITPSAAFLPGESTLQFYAEVLGENNPSQAVTWETTLGSVSTDGVLAAPASTPGVQRGTLTATSQEDTEISASIDFNVRPLAVAFTPSAARTIRILPGRQAFAVGSHWSLGSAGPVGPKDPDSTIDVPFDWSAWLADIGGATLAKVEFFVTGGLKGEDIVPNETGGTVLVSGGLPKGTATITCRITTATTPARTDDRTVVLQIGEQ